MGHNHHPHHESKKNLKIAFFINISFTIFEFIGGLYVNSVAILSDALHDLGDSISLGLALFFESKAENKADDRFTFGYKRFSLLGALINGFILVSGSCLVIYKSITRLFNPEFSDANGMIFIAIIGVLVNGYASWKVSKGHTLNERVISWHLLEDVLGWTAVLIAAIVLKFWETPYLDPALSISIALYILWNAYKNLKETVYLFLQGNPTKEILEEIKEKFAANPNVANVHHMHIWSLDGENNVFTTHVKLRNIESLEHLSLVKQLLKNEIEMYSFEDFTIETELESETCQFIN